MCKDFSVQRASNDVEAMDGAIIEAMAAGTAQAWRLRVANGFDRPQLATGRKLIYS
jgi:hypothetical protein